MFSAVYFFNLKGDILIQRLYRDDIECASLPRSCTLCACPVPSACSLNAAPFLTQIS